MAALPKADQYDYLGDNLQIQINRRNRVVVLPEITNRGVAALLIEDEEYWSKHFQKRPKPTKEVQKTPKPTSAKQE